MRYLTLSIAAIVGVTFINAPSPAYSAPKQYSLAVGSLGGTMGRLGAGISSAFNKKQTTDKMAVSPGGGRANPARLGTGGADFAFSFSNFTSTALAGKAPVIAKFWDSCYHQYVAKSLYDSGIQS
jgi:TRAP-type uncharacterized transport system substrate-binding protein